MIVVRSVPSDELTAADPSDGGSGRALRDRLATRAGRDAESTLVVSVLAQVATGRVTDGNVGAGRGRGTAVLKCPLCGGVDFERQQGRMDSRWGLTTSWC
jgi:hypothetical protein